MTAWHDLQTWAPVPLTPLQFRALERAYADPPRAYHSLAHILSVVEHWRDVDQRLGWRRRSETFLAVLYHDAIYIAGRSDNEERSAVFARDQIACKPALDIDEVERLIRLTAAHGKLSPDAVDRDAALFLDCDMAILGAAPGEFAAYDRGIASEYAHVPALMYRAGRRRFLEQLVEKPRIFLSEDFHARLDRQARENVRLALATEG